jgi:hypothetical protein
MDYKEDKASKGIRQKYQTSNRINFIKIVGYCWSG